MTIKHVSRSSILGVYRGNEVTLWGEAYLPGYGSPDFLAYSSTLAVKDAHGSGVQLDESKRRDILDAVGRAMSLRKQTMEFEP